MILPCWRMMHSNFIQNYYTGRRGCKMFGTVCSVLNYVYFPVVQAFSLYLEILAPTPFLISCIFFLIAEKLMILPKCFISLLFFPTQHCNPLVHSIFKYKCIFFSLHVLLQHLPCLPGAPEQNQAYIPQIFCTKCSRNPSREKNYCLTNMDLEDK